MMSKPNRTRSRKPAAMAARIMRNRYAAPPHAQRGLVVFVALIVLVAMTLAGLAVMRSSNTAILSAGNLSFKQSSVLSGDAGIERAITDFLRAPTTGPTLLENRIPAQGYYATWFDDDPANEKVFDPVTWGSWGDSTKRVSAGQDAAGNTVYYVIHRMCMVEGPVDQDNCVVLGGDLTNASKGGAQYGEKAIKAVSRPWFRVTARIEGPKQTVSYVQTMLY